MSATRYIEKRWELEGDRHRDVDVNDLEKKRFAYWIWRKDFKKKQKQEDVKKSEIKDTVTEIYQMIGLDNVFQGVWFQGVTLLAAQRGCRFSVIPIILSVLVSLATIVVVYVKISKVRELETRIHKNRLDSKRLHSFICACENQGINTDLSKIEDEAEKCYSIMAMDIDKASARSGKKMIILLVLLTIASILFAWLIHLTMCAKYI